MVESICLNSFEYEKQEDDMILLTESGPTEVFVSHISFINNLDDSIVNQIDTTYYQLRMDNDVSVIVDKEELKKLHYFIEQISQFNKFTKHWRSK